MIFRHFSRRLLLQTFGYRPRAFPQPFLRRSLASMTGGDLPPPRSIGQRLRDKTRDYAITMVLIVAYGIIILNIPSWDEFLDSVCQIVPPKTVDSDASSPPPNNTYNPTQQDHPQRQPIYFPDEFRVLIVEPGSGAEEICCRLVNVAKSWRTRYDALSYVWGDETVRENIDVDGLRTSITKNLHSALVHLRDPVQPRILWVDALCINQDDMEERDDQVKKMGAIYSSARRVIVWLGEQSKEVQGAFSVIEDAALSLKHDGKDALKIADLDWTPVFNLLSRPWFQRTWIIQEAVLARDPVVACGFDTIPWKDLCTCCSSDSFRELVPNDAKVAQALRAVDMITHGRHECHTKFTYRGRGRHKKKKKYAPDFRLVSTLYETRGFQCKEGRDKVFGIISMVTNVGPEDEALAPNSQASVEEIFETVAKWDITKNESLEILSYCSRKSWTHPQLPSWVPDFSDMDESNPVSFLRGKKPQQAPNPGFEDGLQPFFFKKDDKTVLVLSGEVVDSIAAVGAVTESPKLVVYADSKNGDKKIAGLDKTAVLNRREWLRECVRIALAADPVPRHGNDNAVDFWKSNTLGMSPYQFSHFQRVMTPPSRHSAWYPVSVLGYTKFLYKGADANPDWYARWKTWRGYEDVDRSFRHFAYKRRFCATRTGKMGWVPGAAIEGDLVCQISGAQVPIILRPLGGEFDSYRVVGDAHIDGLMLTGKQNVYVGGDRIAIV